MGYWEFGGQGINSASCTGTGQVHSHSSASEPSFERSAEGFACPYVAIRINGQLFRPDGSAYGFQPGTEFKRYKSSDAETPPNTNSDCCNQLKTELETLKSEIAKLQNINEQNIIDKAVRQASQLLDPKIAAIGMTATAAMSGVNSLQIALPAASAIATSALSQVGKLTVTVAGIAAKLVPILAAIAGLAGTAGTLQVLGARIDGVESYIDSIANDLFKIQNAAYDAKNTGNQALGKANQALGGIDALQALTSATRRVADNAMKTALSAHNFIIQLSRNLEHIRGTANDALIVARRAISRIDILQAKTDSAIASLNSRLDEFELGVRLIYEDLVGKLRLAVIYFTESINGIQKNVYRILDIHSREIYRFNGLISNLDSKINYVINSYVPTYVRTAIGTLSGVIESLKARVSKLEKLNLESLVNNLTNTVNNIVNNNPAIKNLTNKVNNITNTTNTYVTNVVNNVNNNITTTLNNRVGTLENQLKESEKVNKEANQNLDILKGLILALPVTLASNQTYQNAAINAAATGSCKSLSNGGCSSSPLPKMQNDLFGANTKLDLLLQTGQGALLTKINQTTTGIASVLGTKIHIGGISGALGRFMSSSTIDRTLNLVTAAGVIHNCLMLSTSIQDTFFGILDNIVAIPSLIKDPDGTTIDTKEIFSKHLDKIFSGLFGAEEWKAIKVQWTAYSTIARTASNILSNVRDIVDETSQIQVTTSNWVAQLGNGLTDEGVIGEDNWDYKDSNQRPKGKYFGRLERIREGLEKVENVFEDLEQVTSSVKSIVETANEIKENTTAINKAIDDANKAAQKDRNAKVEGLELPNFSLDDLF